MNGDPWRPRASTEQRCILLGGSVCLGAALSVSFDFGIEALCVGRSHVADAILLRSLSVRKPAIWLSASAAGRAGRFGKSKGLVSSGSPEKRLARQQDKPKVSPAPRSSPADDGGKKQPPPPRLRRAPASAQRWDGLPVAIIGGGLSGLACGLSLARRGIKATIFDTGKRGPGGRASSRVLQIKGGRQVVDHAVQAFTVENDEVQQLISEMELAGVVQRWEGRVGTLSPDGSFRERAESESPLWIGSQDAGVAALSTGLARDQDLQMDVWVAKLSRAGDAWDLLDTGGDKITTTSYSYVVMAHNGKCADRLINTAPTRTLAHAPLRCRFTSTASPTNDRLELSSIWACVIAIPSGGVKFDGAFVDGDDVLSWIGNNSTKYPQAANSRLDVVTLLSTSAYGSANKCSQERERKVSDRQARAKVSSDMRSALGRLLDTNSADWEVLHLQLWGAAVPLNVCSQHFVHDPRSNIGVCGDWLTAPSVEGALFSGMVLAGAIDKHLCGDGLSVPSDVTVAPRFKAVTNGQAIGSFGSSIASLTVDQALSAAAAAARASSSSSGKPTAGVKFSEPTWNFAFGANINPWKLRTKRGINPLDQVAGKLPGWRLVFNHSGGMGNIEPIELVARNSGNASGPDAVHGMLLLLTPEDFETLSGMEHEYVTTEVTAEGYDGRLIKALAFTSPPDYKLLTYPPPPERYIKLIQRGASESKLSPEYKTWLRTITGVQDRGLEYYDHAAWSRRQQAARRNSRVK